MTFNDVVVPLWNLGMLLGLVLALYNTYDVLKDYQVVRARTTDQLYREQTRTNLALQLLILCKFVIYLCVGMIALLAPRGTILGIPDGTVVILGLWIGGMLLVLISVLTNRWRHYLLNMLRDRALLIPREDQ